MRLEVKAVFAVAFILVATFAIPVLAIDLYRPGVEEGEYVKLAFELTGNDVAALDPSYRYNNIDWIQCAIMSVSGNEVTMSWIDHFKNGTLEFYSDDSYRLDVVTGKGTWGSNYDGEDLARWVLSANLDAGDPIRADGSDKVDRIEFRTYSGVRREVAVVFLHWEWGGLELSSTCIFDRSSGMLLERELKGVRLYDTSEGEAGTYQIESLSFLETNIFSSSNGGSSPDGSTSTGLLIPSIAFVLVPIIAISIGASAVFFLARKKRAKVSQPSLIPKEQTTSVSSSEQKASTPSYLDSPPPPLAPQAQFCMECGAQLESTDKFCLNCGAPREA